MRTQGERRLMDSQISNLDNQCEAAKSVEATRERWIRSIHMKTKETLILTLFFSMMLTTGCTSLSTSDLHLLEVRSGGML
jgi:hypothetical protein